MCHSIHSICEETNPAMRKWGQGKWNDGGVWNGASPNPPVRRAMKIIKMPVASLNPADLNAAAAVLLTRLADNHTDFPSPPVTALTADHTALNTKLNELASLQTQLAAKSMEIDATCVLVRTDMNALGDWAEGVTQDPAKLVLIAPLRATPTPMGLTPRVMNLLLSIGDMATEIHAHWQSLAKQGVKTYDVQTQLNPLNNDPNSGTWVPQPSTTKSKSALTGFTPGARIWVRVRGVGTGGIGEWSDPATSIVP